MNNQTFGLRTDQARRLRLRTKRVLHFIMSVFVLSLFYNNCSSGSSSSSNSSFALPVSPYCPYLPSKVFANSVTVSGHAVYEYRVDGNGVVANGVLTISPLGTTGIQTFSISINGQNYSWTSGATFTARSVATALAAVINLDSNALASAIATSTALTLTPKDETQILSVVLSNNLIKTQGDTPHAIRFAEVSVLDSNQTIVQCAETDASGNFSFTLPQGNSTYTISVSPRANNANLQAYVLQDPSSNQTYSVSTHISANQPSTNVKIIAPASGTLEGGAFNILDQLARANIFLRNYTSTAQGCGGTLFPDCTPFSVGPMVYVYWKKGFNPGVYEGMDPSSGISYYLPGRSQLYIMGGINGDVNYSDTDHFDNSVIIHEYGHFMEDHYGKSDSPGGSHDGYSQLDPRLAWSEGWADFFQASVTGDPIYRDTYGNPDGSAGLFFNEDIENLSALSADKPGATPSGEGNYHEFSITRLLWDAIDPHPVTGAGANPPDENVQGPFAEIWAIFGGTSSGFRSLDLHFRSIGFFHLLQNSKSNHTDWSSLRAMEFQDGDRKNYGAVLSTGGCFTSSIVTMNPVTTTDVEYFRNDRFYSYYHPGGNLDLVLNYTTATGALADLDLLIYPEKHYLDETSNIKASSQSSPPTNCISSTQCTEHVSVNLDAGFYLVNVRAAPANSGTTNFGLVVNAKPACITN